MKTKRASYDIKGETSTLVALKQFKQNKLTTELKKNSIANKVRKPCTFCKKDHWNNQCHIYPTLKHRLERLKELNACTNCLRTGHATNNCNKRKPLCFYCKNIHNTALCPSKYKEATQTVESNEENEEIEPTTITNSITEKGLQQGKRILLLYKEINVVNPNYPKNQQKALALFDIGVQLSFISKGLANRLRLLKTDEKELKIASFGNKTPKICLATKAKLGVKIGQKDTTLFEATVIDYLTNELQVIDLDKKGLRSIKQQNQLVGLNSRWKQPDILIGADYFFKSIQLNKIENLKSGFSLLHTNVGPMIAGSGYTDEIYNYNSISVESTCIAIEASQEQSSESSYKVIHDDGSVEPKNHEIYQCISESNQIHDNSTDGIKQLIILNAELETDVEVLKGGIWTINEQLKKLLVDRDLSEKPCEFSQRGEDKFERTLEQKCNLEEQKDTAEKRQRQAVLPENESNHRLVEWQEKSTQIENSPAAVCLKPKLIDNDALFRGNAKLLQTNQRLQIKVDVLREQMAKHISSFDNTDILAINQQTVFEQQFWDEFRQGGKLVENLETEIFEITKSKKNYQKA
ncbi:unnamed protein product [Onchocerca ochengi]|uniref:DUF1758 domain-containing protein n=1 Tax=Onchocerca ochengi TaxID=42157 RepID=A0A182ET49_ONCOC|nr:unnamed protein product [Onchocerca ochengi]